MTQTAKAQHTPGPWQIVRHNHRIIVQDEDGRFQLADAGLADNRVAEANARLIAAAPEILEALRRAAKRLEAVLRFHGAGQPEAAFETHADLQAAHFAIAKAEGR